MSEEVDLFADGVGEITLVGGMVRIDLVSLSATEKDDSGQPLLEMRRRLVMPPEGFLRSFAAMENLVKQLVDAGVIRKTGGESQIGDAGDLEATAVPPATRPTSPNFSRD